MDKIFSLRPTFGDLLSFLDFFFPFLDLPILEAFFGLFFLDFDFFSFSGIDFGIIVGVLVLPLSTAGTWVGGLTGISVGMLTLMSVCNVLKNMARRSRRTFSASILFT
jgi:hypothetical protein